MSFIVPLLFVMGRYFFHPHCSTNNLLFFKLIRRATRKQHTYSQKRNPSQHLSPPPFSQSLTMPAYPKQRKPYSTTLDLLFSSKKRTHDPLAPFEIQHTSPLNPPQRERKRHMRQFYCTQKKAAKHATLCFVR